MEASMRTPNDSLTIGISMPVWKRPGLTGAVMRWHKTLSAVDVEIDRTVAGCSREKDVVRALEHGWSVAHAENSPLSRKHSATMAVAYEGHLDGVVHLNSDDFLSAGYLRSLNQIVQASDPAAVCLRDQSYLTTRDPGTCYHLEGAKPGSATYVSARVLERSNCNLWPGQQERHLDKLLLSTIRSCLHEGEDILQINNHFGGPVHLLGIKQHEGEQMWSLRELFDLVDDVKRRETKPFLQAHYKELLSDPYITSLLDGGQQP